MRVHLGDDVREIDFPIGSFVYLRMRDEPLRGMVVGYNVRPDHVLYAVTWGNGQDTYHFAVELTATYEPEYSRAAEEERE